MNEINELNEKSIQTDLPVLYTDKEAAAYMKLSPRWGHVTVQVWAREGKLRGGKVGDHWRFRKQDLDDFIFNKK